MTYEELQSAIEHVTAMLEELLMEQQPLGPEFEAIWDANVADLYES